MLINYRGFNKTYDKHIKKLKTYVNIYPVFSFNKALCNVPVKLRALWDTGATITAIKPETLERMKSPLIRSKSSAMIAGIGGVLVKADYTLTNIYFTDNFYIKHCPTYIMDFPANFDIIIGMDIISMGDFSVCNTDYITSFSFAVPPFPDRLNLAEKAILLNEKQKK